MSEFVIWTSLGAVAFGLFTCFHQRWIHQALGLANMETVFFIWVSDGGGYNLYLETFLRGEPVLTIDRGFAAYYTPDQLKEAQADYETLREHGYQASIETTQRIKK